MTSISPDMVDERARLRARLVDHVARFLPEYDDHLTNHAPMALIALHTCGARDDEVDRFLSAYTPRLSARTKLVDVDVGDVDARAVIAECAHEAGAAAFHGMIRLRFALLADVDVERAHAAAYWRSSTSPLAALARAPCGTRSLDETARAIATARIARPEGRSIRARHASLVADETFRSLAEGLAPGGDDDDFRKLAHLARDLYASRDDFTSLHALTGTEAAVALLAHDVARDVIYRATAQAVLASIANGGAALAPADLPLVDDDWPTVARRACAADDDHTAKLVVACRALDERWPDRSWRALAAHRVGRGHA